MQKAKGLSQAKADLPTYSLENQFRFNSRTTFTEDQLSVIDSIWNLSTLTKDSKIKLSIINTLIAQYFQYNKGRKFSITVYLMDLMRESTRLGKN